MLQSQPLLFQSNSARLWCYSIYCKVYSWSDCSASWEKQNQTPLFLVENRKPKKCLSGKKTPTFFFNFIQLDISAGKCSALRQGVRLPRSPAQRQAELVPSHYNAAPWKGSNPGADGKSQACSPVVHSMSWQPWSATADNSQAEISTFKTRRKPSGSLPS